MATIFVDNVPFEVHPGQNVLEATLSLKMNLPYFCWHPAMGSVGACRQCAVKQYRDEKDTHGKLVIACMTPVADGMRISIADPEVEQFRAGIIEGMMENHPHDCPVCDEGGECHLQDMTVMTGHDYRAYRFPKRTFRNQYLGPFVNHEMNRCIQCYRCVRFYREYAGGTDFNVFKLRDIAYFGRKEDGVLESEFAGNLAEVCPTGVFTDATHKKHYTRKWDLTMAPSVCVHCSLGCNTTAGARYGLLRRLANRYNGAVNGYFLCDRGRFGYEFVNSDRRIRSPERRVGTTVQATSAEEAIEHLRQLMTGEQPVIGIGSPRASLEANFALRTLVGSEHFHMGMADAEAALVERMLDLLRRSPAQTPAMREAESYDGVLVLGEDVTNTAPLLALSLRQSARQQTLAAAEALHIPRWQDHAVRELAQHQHGPFFVAAVSATRLDDVATETYRAAPADLARLGAAIAHELDPESPAVDDLPEALQLRARQWATALKASERPLVVSGAGCRSAQVIEAAALVASALCRAGRPAGLVFTASECNSVGAAMLGGASLSAAFDAVRARPGPVIVLENDLFRRAPAAQVEAFLSAVPHLVVLDSLQTATTAHAEFMVPVGTFAESDGTLVNNEGRAQRFFQPMAPEGDVRESWRWLAEVRAVTQPDGPVWHSLDEVISSLIEAVPALAAIGRAAPPSSFRIDGARVPRESHRYSGRTSIQAGVEVSEPRPPRDPDSALSYTMEGASVQPPAALIPFVWSPGWNSYQAVNKFQTEIAGTMRGGDAGVRLLVPGTAEDSTTIGAVPPAFAPRAGEWLVVPLHHIYGSEELSNAAPAVAQLAPQAYLALNAADAHQLGAAPDAVVEVTLDGTPHRLPVRVVPSLPAGVAGMPVGLQGGPVAVLPAWAAITRPA